MTLLNRADPTLVASCLNDMEHKVATLERANKELEDRCASHVALAQEERVAVRASCETEYDALKGEHASLLHKYDALTAACAAADQMAADASAANVKHAEENATLHVANAELTAALTAADQMAADASAANMKRDEEFAELFTSHGSLASALDAAQRKKCELAARVVAEKDACNVAIEKFCVLNDKCDALKNENATLKGKLQDADAAVQEKVNALENENAMLLRDAREHAVVRERMDSLKNENARLLEIADGHAAMQEKLLALENENTMLKDKSRDDEEGVQEKLDAMQQKCKKLKRKLRSFEWGAAQTPHIGSVGRLLGYARHIHDTVQEYHNGVHDGEISLEVTGSGMEKLEGMLTAILNAAVPKKEQYDLYEDTESGDDADPEYSPKPPPKRGRK